MIHYDIPVFVSYVRSEYLYDLKEGFDYFTPATIFSISSFPGEPLKFHLLADDKIMFSNVPFYAISNSKTSPRLSEKDAIYELCPSEKCIIIQYEYLTLLEKCCVWKKDHTLWQTGIYLFTVEWIENKYQQHLIELADGNYVFCPSNFITWGEEIPDEIPVYGNK